MRELPVLTDTTTPAGASTGIDRAAGLLRAVGDPVRARILDLLAAEQLCVCHLQEALELKQTLVSHHLRALRDAGLVDVEPHGRFSYYRLRPGAFATALDALQGLELASRTHSGRRPC